MVTNKYAIAKTSVHKFFTTVMFVTAMLPVGFASAASDEDCRTRDRLISKQNRSAKEENDLALAQSNCDAFRKQESRDDKRGEECKRAKEDWQAAVKDTDRSCVDAGMGAGASCRTRLNKDTCRDEIEEASSVGESVSDALLTALGVPGSAAATQMHNPQEKAACPMITGKSFHEEQKQLKDDLKEAQNELTDIKKDLADEQKEYNTKYKEIQDRVRAEQKNVRENKAALDKESREMAGKLIEQQQSLAKSARDNSLTILRLQSAMVKADSELAQGLVQLSETAAKRTCQKHVLGLKKELDTSSNRAGGVGNLIGAGSALMKKLQAEFDNCMAGIDEQRAAIYKAHQAQKNDFTKQIQNAESDGTDIADQIQSLQGQVQEEKKAIDQKKNDADKDLFEEINAATQELSSLQQETTQRLNALREKQMVIQQRINELNAKLMMMNRQPVPPKNSTKTADDAERDYLQEDLAYWDARLACCPSTTKDSFCDSTAYDKVHKRSSTTTETKGTK